MKHKKLSRSVCLLALWFGGAHMTPVVADDISYNTVEIPLPIMGFVREVLERNAATSYDRLEIQVKNEQIEFESNIFEPVVSASYSHAENKSPNNTGQTISRNNLGVFDERKGTYEVALTGLTSLGGQWRFSVNNSKSNSNLIESLRDFDTEYDSRVQLTFNQPLLKGFGKAVVFAQRDAATIDRDVVQASYQQRVMDLILVSTKKYWELHAYKILRDGLKRNAVISAENYQLMKQSAKLQEVSELEVLEAKTNVLERRIELESVVSDIESLHNQLLNLLNATGHMNGTVLFVTEDLDAGEVLNSEDPERFIQYAKQHLPELRMNDHRRKQAKLALKKSKLEALPQLDLNASTWVSNLSDKEIYEEAFKDDFTSWQVGLEFSMPVMSGKRQKHAIEVARLRLEQIRYEREALYKELELDVKARLQQLNSYNARLSAVENIYQTKQQVYNDSVARFKAGNLNIHELLEQEETLIADYRRMVSLWLQTRLSHAEFDRSVGMIQEKYYVGDIYRLPVRSATFNLSARSFQ